VAALVVVQQMALDVAAAALVVTVLHLAIQ
jgi:hypothetical protein